MSLVSKARFGLSWLLALALFQLPLAGAEQFASPILSDQTRVGQFQRSSLNTGSALGQTVLYGRLSNATQADLAVFQIREDNVRYMSLYRQIEGQFEETAFVQHKVPKDVIFVDMGRWQGRDVLMFFTATNGIRFDPVTGRSQTLVTYASIYNTVADKELPTFDVMRDLNDDGFDDFIVPGFEGYQVSIQQVDGGFTKPVLMRAPPIMEISYNNHPWYKARKIYHTDMNGDGQRDLAFWLEQDFIVYLQRDGLFDSQGLPFSTEVQIDAEGYEGISMRMGGEDQSNVVKKALFQLRDLDGDHYAELVTLAVKSEGVFKKQTTYAFYNGLASETALATYSMVPDSVIESPGIQFNMEEQDLNNDGQIDIIVSSVELGVGKIVRALLTGSIRIDLGFYQMRNGRYPLKPNVVRNIKATFSLSTGDVFFPSVLMADVSGDGLADLLVQDGNDGLLIYPGIASERLFSKDAIEVKAPMPTQPERIQVADLNADGKQDLIVRLEVKGEPFQVLVLMAR